MFQGIFAATVVKRALSGDMCFVAVLHSSRCVGAFGPPNPEERHGTCSRHDKDEQDDAPAFFDAFCRPATTTGDITVARDLLVKQHVDPPARLASGSLSKPRPS